MSSSTPKWQEQAFYTNPTTVQSPVKGQDQTFAAVSTKQIFRMKAFIAPLAKLIAALWQDNKKDNGKVDRRFVSKEKVLITTVSGATMPATDSEEIVEPIKEGLAKLRFEQKNGAVREFLTDILDDKNLNLLAEIVMDSMVDLFDRDRKNGAWPPAEEFLGKVDAPSFIEMLIGVAKANKGKLGPLLENAGIDSTVLAAAVNSKMEEILPKPKAG